MIRRIFETCTTRPDFIVIFGLLAAAVVFMAYCFSR